MFCPRRCIKLIKFGCLVAKFAKLERLANLCECSLQVDLVTLFPQHRWLFPSEAYQATEAGSSIAWRTLFKALGCTDFIQIPLVTLKLDPKQKAASLWADCELGQSDASGCYTVQDWSSEEFRAVVQSLLQQCKDEEAVQLHCRHLAYHMDALWEAEYAACISLQLGRQTGGESCLSQSHLSYIRAVKICLSSHLSLSS